MSGASKVFLAFFCAVSAPLALAAKVYDVASFGAKGDGATKDTAAIQKAIESYRVSDEHKEYLKSLR